jgi:hypothetical protein
VDPTLQIMKLRSLLMYLPSRGIGKEIQEKLDDSNGDSIEDKKL